MSRSLVFKRLASNARNVFVFNNAAWDPKILSDAKASCSVIENFISEDEEKSLFAELEPHMKRLKYEKDHWDFVSYFFNLNF
jgi:alkylated DNA repair protein alkB family protein 7